MCFQLFKSKNGDLPLNCPLQTRDLYACDISVGFYYRKVPWRWRQYYVSPEDWSLTTSLHSVNTLTQNTNLDVFTVWECHISNITFNIYYILSFSCTLIFCLFSFFFLPFFFFYACTSCLLYNRTKLRVSFSIVSLYYEK